MARKPLSQAEREQRRQAGRESGRSRRGENRINEHMEDSRLHQDEESQSINPTRPGKRKLSAEVLAALADYESNKGGGLTALTWQDAKAREQVIGEILANIARQTDADIRRGTLMTREQVDMMDEECDSIVISVIESVADFFAQQFPPEKKLDAMKTAREWIDGARQKISDKLREIRG